LRDIVLADTVFIAFTTRAFATGIPTVLAGTPVVSAYEDAGLTQITAGITLGIDHDAVVGLNMLTIIATGANGYEADKDYNLVITTGTVGGVSVVGEVVGQFSIQRAPVNWANVTGPTTAVDLSGTDIQLVDTTTTNTDMRGTDSAALASALGTPSDFGSGTSTIAANLEDMADDGTAVFDRSTDSLQAIRDRGDAAWTTGAGTGLTALASGTAQAGTATTIQLAAAETFADDILNGTSIKIISGTGAGQARVIIDYVGATDTATIAPAWTTNPSSDSVYEIVDGSVNLSVFNLGEVTGSFETSADVADAVWDEDATDHQTQGTFGQAIGDPVADATTIYQSVATDATGDNVAVDVVAVKADTVIPEKNTAFSNIYVLMVDSIDHVTPKTGLTLTVQRSLDGAAFGAATGTAAEISNGMYQFDATAADMNGDTITFRFSGTGADDTFLTIVTR